MVSSEEREPDIEGEDHVTPAPAFYGVNITGLRIESMLNRGGSREINIQQIAKADSVKIMIVFVAMVIMITLFDSCWQK